MLRSDLVIGALEVEHLNNYKNLLTNNVLNQTNFYAKLKSASKYQSKNFTLWLSFEFNIWYLISNLLLQYLLHILTWVQVQEQVHSYSLNALKVQVVKLSCHALSFNHFDNNVINILILQNSTKLQFIFFFRNIDIYQYFFKLRQHAQFFFVISTGYCHWEG